MTAEQLMRLTVDYIDEQCTNGKIGHVEYNNFLERMSEWVHGEQWNQENIGPLYDED